MSLKKICYHPLSILVFSLICLYFILSLRRNLKRLNVSYNNLKQVETQVKKLETGLEEKQQQLEQAQLPLAQEKIARNELLLKKPGEYVVQLPKLASEQDQFTPSPSPQPLEQWRQVLFTGY
jgi:cell division protein FtsB